VSGTWRKVRVMLSVMFAYMTQYRAELYLWALASTLPLFSMGAWMHASRAGASTLSVVEVGQYFLAVYVVRQLTVVWVVWDFEANLHDGTLAHRLLQPLEPVWHHIAEHVAERGARLPFTTLLVGVCWWALDEVRFVPSVVDVVAFLGVLLLVFAFRFLVQYTFSLLAFWTERAHAVEGMWNLPYLFLSGMLAPLSAYPDAVMDVVRYTPFPSLIAFPAQVLLGQDVDVGHHLTVLAAWGIPLLVVNRWLWRRGLARFSAMGA